MNQIDALKDYLPSAWLEGGVLLLQSTTNTAHRTFKRLISSSQAVALGLSVGLLMALTQHTSLAQPQEIDSLRAADQYAHSKVDLISQRIALKLARFQLADEAIDASLLDEARLTLAAIANR